MMSNFNVLEPVVQEIKKLASNILLPQNPFDRIISVCNRFIALKEVANFQSIKKDIELAWADVEVRISKLRALIGKITK